MKQVYCYFVVLCNLLFTNWCTPLGRYEKNNNLSFYGTLVTHQGQTYKMEEIRLDDQYKKIIMFDTPKIGVKERINPTTKKKEYILITSPESNHSEINLENIKEMRVPRPSILWVYQPKKKYRKHTYIEVIVLFKDKTRNVKKSFLMKKKTKLHAKDIRTASPIKKEISLAAINILTIEGYMVKNNRDIQQPSTLLPVSPHNK